MAGLRRFLIRGLFAGQRPKNKKKSQRDFDSLLFSEF